MTNGIAAGWPSVRRVRTALRLATRPTRVCIDGQAEDRYEFDERVGVLWLQHDGKPPGTVVQIDY